MFHPAQLRHRIRGQPGEHQRGGGAQVGGRHRRPAQAAHPLHDGAGPLARDLRAHAPQLRHVHEPLRINLLGHHAHALAHGHHGHHLRLQIRRKPGKGERRDLHPFQPAVRAHPDGSIRRFHRDVRFNQGVNQPAQVLADRALDRHLAPEHGGGDHQGPGLDAIRQDAMAGPVEPQHPFHPDARRALPGDLRPHPHQTIRQIRDLRLTGRLFDDRHAIGEGRRHHDIPGGKHGGSAGADQMDRRAPQPLGVPDDVAMLDGKGGSQGFEAFQVQIHRTRPDDAPARHGHFCAPVARQQRPKHADGGAHEADQLMRGGPPAVLVGTNDQPPCPPRMFRGRRALVPAHLHAKETENLGHGGDVRDARDALDDHLLLRQEAGGHDRQRGVLGPAHLDGTAQRPAGLQNQPIHERFSTSKPRGRPARSSITRAVFAHEVT